MKTILMGTPEFVVPIFDAIADQHDVIAVFTRAPKPTGRKMIITKTPVHEWAEARGIKVSTNIKEIESLQKPDFIIVAAYGIILKQDVLDFAPCINIHPSLLPKYRGASPIISAILNGDKESGVCLIALAPEVDAGDIYACESFKIAENDTTKDVEKKVSELAADMILHFLKTPDEYAKHPQVGTPTFTKKVTNEDSMVDIHTMPAEKVHNIVRSIGGRTTINGIDLKILETEIQDKQLKIKMVQPAGKKPMSWADFLRGHHVNAL